MIKHIKIVYIISCIFSLVLASFIFIKGVNIGNYVSVVNNVNNTVDRNDINGFNNKLESESQYSLLEYEDIETVADKEDVKVLDINSNDVKGVESFTFTQDTTPKSIHMIEDEMYSKGSYDFGTLTPSDTTEVTGGVDRLVTSTVSNSDKEVMGFMPYWQLSKYNTLQYDKLTSIAYFALTCYDNGEWVTDDPGYTAFYSANFTNMVNLARQNNVKVYLVVKNFHNRSIRDLVANKNGAGDELIKNIVNVVRAKGLDGVNMDFEYIPDSSYPVTDTLRSNFVSWHDKLAKRMHLEFPGSHVSTDVFGSSGSGYSAYDIAGLGASAIDYIMFMTYDYIITSCYEGKRIFPMSPLYGNSNWNVSYHLNEAAKKAPPGKIIMGVPYYGIDFEVRTSDKDLYNARIAYYSGCRGTIETYGSIVDPEFDSFHNSNTIKWNSTEKATWYSYLYSGKWRHGYYDDPKSLGAKYDYMRSAKFGGIGIWALGYDSGTSDLWNVLRDKFQRGPYIIALKSDTSSSRANKIINELKVDIVSEIGNNVWKVRPKSGITTASINNAKKYHEVLVAGFENDSSVRDIILP